MRRPAGSCCGTTTRPRAVQVAGPLNLFRTNGVYFLRELARSYDVTLVGWKDYAGDRTVETAAGWPGVSEVRLLPPAWEPRAYHRAAATLQDAGGDQGVHAVGKSAEKGAERENPDRGGKHPPGAEAIGNPPGGRNKHSERQQIGGQCKFELNRALMKVTRDRRQSGREDRGIEIFHEQRAGNDQRHKNPKRYRPASLSFGT